MKLNEYGLFVPDSVKSNGHPLHESIAELERQLYSENAGWNRLSGSYSERDFSYHGRSTINDLAYSFWVKNPLIARGVETENNYTFGRGVKVGSENDIMAEVVNEFWTDENNVLELTSLQSQVQKNSELKLFGNVFLELHRNKVSGKVTIRSVPVGEIQDVIYDEKDSRRVAYYKRVYSPQSFDWASGTTKIANPKTEYIADWRYKAPKLHATRDDMVLYHLKVNCLSDSKWGNSEVYRSLDWARAYTRFLEDWATLVASHAQFAYKLRTNRSVAAEKEAIEAHAEEPSTAGSWWIEKEGVSDLTPMPRGGPTVSAADGRRFLLMVSAGMGIWEHYFGDPSTGNLATATAMELPMLKMFQARQQFWWEVYTDLIDFTIRSNIDAPRGLLARFGSKKADYRTGEIEYELSEEVPWKYSVDFPEIVEEDVPKLITTIVAAATAKPPLIPVREAARLVMMHLGVDNIEGHLDELDEQANNADVLTALNALSKTVNDLAAGQSASPALSIEEPPVLAGDDDDFDDDEEA